jgi:hypothetical protein
MAEPVARDVSAGSRGHLAPRTPRGGRGSTLSDKAMWRRWGLRPCSVRRAGRTRQARRADAAGATRRYPRWRTCTNSSRRSPLGALNALPRRRRPLTRRRRPRHRNYRLICRALHSVRLSTTWVRRYRRSSNRRTRRGVRWRISRRLNRRVWRPPRPGSVQTSQRTCRAGRLAARRPQVKPRSIGSRPADSGRARRNPARRTPGRSRPWFHRP